LKKYSAGKMTFAKPLCKQFAKEVGANGLLKFP